MELFSVVCTTCQSKLKVRERGVIGQILACPKCQGMVLVQPPPGWVESGVAATAPAPVAEATSQPMVPAARTPAHSSSNFEDAAALLSQPTIAAAAPPVVDGPSAPVDLPHGEWISPQTQAMRRWLLVGGLASIGVIVLIGALAYAFSGSKAKTPIAQQQPETSPVEAPVAPVEEPAPLEEEKPVVTAVAEDKKTPETTPVEPMPMGEPAVTPDPMPMPVKPEVATTDPQPKAEETSPQPLNTFNVEGTLKQFGALIEEKPFEEQPMGEPAPVPEGLQTEPDAMPITDDEPLPRPDARRVDVARRLNDPLEAIETSGVPLADFLQLITDMTTLPITLDPTALPAIKVSPETKVTINLKGTKVGDVLTEALRPHNLAFIATDRQVVVLPAASTKVELREIKHEVADLAKTEVEAKVLAELIHAMIDPASWDDAGGRGSIKVEGTTITIAQTPEAHFATVVLCEKLRLARQMPTRSAYPARVLALAPRAMAADAVLDTPVTMNFVPPTRLTRVADHIKRTTGLRVLVDWRTLADAGWTPEGEVKAGVASQPLSVFLDRLTQRMEIAWRVVDGNTVQLTSREGLAALPDVEVYPVAVDDGAALIALLQKELGSALFAPGSPGVLRYDSAGQALVARLPQPAQRKLAQFLAKNK